MSALILSDAFCFLEPAGYILELHWPERLLFAVVLHTCETLGVEFRYLWQCFCMTKRIYLRQIYVKRFFVMKVLNSNVNNSLAVVHFNSLLGMGEKGGHSSRVV